MKEEYLAGCIIRAVVKAVSIPVTIKMRTGWDDKSRNAHKLARIAEEEGVQMLTVHGRTRCQFFKGDADWNYIRKVKETVKIPVIANGDILSPTDAKKCLALSGADGVMLGRGSQGKPWLLKQIKAYLVSGEKPKDPDLKTILATILSHYNTILTHYGIDLGVRMARKHLAWYLQNVEDSKVVRARINKCDTPEQVINLLKRFFKHKQSHATAPL